MDKRAQFWINALRYQDTLDSIEMYKQLSIDLPRAIVYIMMQTLARGEGICADLPGGHFHLKWAGYDDWYTVS